MRAWVAAVALGVSLTAAAQTAQDELEKQLKDMVAKPPSKLLVEFEGLDQPAYKLMEVTFVLDGQSLPTPKLEKLNEGRSTIWHGDIKPGRHRLEYTASFTDVSGVLFSYEAGYKFKVGSASTFEQQPGLEVRVLITPELAPGEKDPKKKFSLKGTADVKMLAKLEDGTMPDVPKPNLGGADAPDAGSDTAEATKLTPAEKAKLAAAAKKAAEDEKKKAKEDALAAKKAAAEEKKRQRDEALAAKKAAAEERKRQAAEAAAAKRGEKVATATDGTKPVQATPTPPPPEPVAEVVDAGAPVVAVVEATPPPPPAVVKPPPAPVEEASSSMLPIAIGGGVALLGIILFLATRKKKAPPVV